MPILFLDLASSQGSIACVDQDRVLAMEPTHNRIRDDSLLPAVIDVVQRSGASFSALNSLACVTGPGGFTSLRVAVSAANAWAWAYHLPLAEIPLWLLLHARSTNENAVWIHSTKRDSVFACDMWRVKPLWEAPTFLSLDALIERLPLGVPWIGELLPEHQMLLRRKGHDASPTLPLEEVLPSFLQTLSYEHRSLQPWYGRSG